MDDLLQVSTERFLGKKALGSAGMINLHSPDLPLFIWPHSLHAVAEEFGISQDIIMGLAVATQSIVYEHRGILLANRNSRNSWTYIDYEALGPLRDGNELSPDYST
jgi:hypothetical protein